MTEDYSKKRVPLHSDTYLDPVRSRVMTVCVAAMAAKSKAIVMVADKAITYGSERPMQADIGIKKILPIGMTGWHALIGGDPSFAKEVIDTAVDCIKDGANSKNHTIPASARRMMLCMKDAYKTVRKQTVIDRILAPILLDETKISELPDNYAEAVYGMLAEFKISCSLLVCGFDLEGIPHIFSITSPGMMTNHDIPGFHAVGVGRDMAIGKLYEYETESADSLDSVLYEVFDAKATAELVQGVGYEWDCSVLVAGRDPVEITKPVRDAVENILGEVYKSPYNNKWGSRLAKIPTWKKTLESFADGILKPPSTKQAAKKRVSKPRPKSTPKPSER